MDYTIESKVNAKMINKYSIIYVNLVDVEDNEVAYVEYEHLGGKKNGTPQDDIWNVSGAGGEDFNHYGICDSATAVKEINTYLKNTPIYLENEGCLLTIVGTTK